MGARNGLSGMGKRAGLLGATVIIAGALTAGTAAAADKPTDYRIALSKTPPVTVDVADLSIDHLATVQQYCTLPGLPPAVGVPFPCVDVPIRVADAGATITGKATNASSGRNGTFSLSCDFVFGAKSSVTVSLPTDFRPRPEDVTLDALSGSGPMGCSWSIVFSSGGSVSGTATGTVTIGRVPDQQKVSAAVSVAIKVTAGSGVYAAAVGGTGSYADSYQAPFTPETASAAAAKPPAGTLRLTLGHSRSRAAVVPLRSSLPAGDPRRLRVVAPKGYRCTAKGTLGSRHVSLGSAKVTRTGGQAVFPGTLRTKLAQTGSWKVSATCTSGHKKLTASAVTVRIA